MKKIGVVLCGSGYKDGSEIREAVATYWALSMHPVEVFSFAPDDFQYDVVNCLTQKPSVQDKRNQLVEAARISRGNIRPLAQCRADELDGLILPGGFGAAKNLCDFAFKGSAATVRLDLKKIINEMYEQKKPLGAICIAPAILVLSLPQHRFEFTVGAKGETAQELEKFGHTHIVKEASQAHIDYANKIITTPAYMDDSAPLHEIFAGIKALVDGVVELS